MTDPKEDSEEGRDPTIEVEETTSCHVTLPEDKDDTTDKDNTNNKHQDNG